MEIVKKRIRSLSQYFKEINEGDFVVIGKKFSEIPNLNLLQKIGFTESLEEGETLIPYIFGRKTKKNVEGIFIPLKDEPKERFSVSYWAKPYGIHSEKMITYTRERYQKKHIPGMEVKMSIGIDQDGDKYILTSPIEYIDKNKEEILLSINIFLEIFGSCKLLNNNLCSILPENIKELNWEILPAGLNPWNKIIDYFEGTIFKSKKISTIEVYRKRIKLFDSLGLVPVAKGKAGLLGYIISKCPNKDEYILENFNYGNATYVFDANYEDLSKLTKKEIIDSGLYIDRITHTKSWEEDIKKIINFKL